MTIHAVDLVCASDSGVAFVGSTGSFVRTWLTNLIAWEPDGDLTQSNDPPRLVETEPDGSGLTYYHGGVWRFKWSEALEAPMENLAVQADAYCPWYRIRYHECRHDETGACAWDDSRKRSGGTIPSEVP
jgi:hypothetical protein